MASSYTTNKTLEKPGNGDYVDTWNVPVNADLDVIDQAFGGTTSINVTAASGVTTLSASQYRSLIIAFSGTLTANVDYRIPSGVGGQWIVTNAATGAFTITVSSAGGGTSVVVGVGVGVAISSDGTNVFSVGTTTGQVTQEISSAFAARDVLAGAGLTGGGDLSSDVTLSADQATAANWRDNVANKVLNPNAVWSSMSETTLTDGATISWDMSSGFDFIVTLGGNRTISNPTNTKVGQKGRLIIQQDGTGSRTMTWGSNYKFANGTKPTLSTTASATDVLYYDVRSSSYIIVSLAGRAFS